jgi:O-antigen/teichoic acid export membrane protein
MGKRSGLGLTAILQSMGGRILFTLITVATGMLTARVLHPAGRGELAALGVWPNFLGGLMTFGLPSAFIYWSRSRPHLKSNLLWASMPITLVSGLLAVLVGVVGIPHWLAKYPPHVIHMAQFFMANAFVVLLTTNARSACEAESDFFGSSVAMVMTPLLALTGLATLALGHWLTPITATAAYIFSGIPTCVFLLTRLRGSCRGWPKDLVRSSRMLLGYGIRSYGVDICGTFSLYADQAVVVRLLAPEAMGIYVVALSLSRMMGIIHQAVAAVLFPKAVALDPERMVALTGRAVRVSTVCTAVCGFGVAVVGPFLLTLLYGRDYSGASHILDVLIMEMVVSGSTLVLTRAHMALGRPGFVTFLQSIGLVLSIPLLIVLVPRWGVVGAGYSLLIASVMRMILAQVSFRRVLGYRAPGLMPKVAELRTMAERLKAGVTAFRSRRVEEGIGA